jgi:hypothetical protein
MTNLQAAVEIELENPVLLFIYPLGSPSPSRSTLERTDADVDI